MSPKMLPTIPWLLHFRSSQLSIATSHKILCFYLRSCCPDEITSRCSTNCFPCYVWFFGVGSSQATSQASSPVHPKPNQLELFPTGNTPRSSNGNSHHMPLTLTFVLLLRFSYQEIVKCHLPILSFDI